MRITKSEMPYAVQMIMDKHGLNKKEAIKYISQMNGEMDEVARKVRKRRAEERKRKSKNFSQEFRKFKNAK